MDVTISTKVSFVVAVVLGEQIDDGAPGRRSAHGQLLFPEQQKSVPFRTGPWGKGALPTGTYQMEKPVALDSGKVAAGYKDEAGLAWWAKLVPSFKTDRTGLGIHPDGNVPGTLGCIGITLEDTKATYDLLVTLANPVAVFVMNAFGNLPTGAGENLVESGGDDPVAGG